MNLKGDSVPCPNKFGALFFQKYWNIVYYSMVMVVTQFFKEDWLLPNWNSNSIVSIPKCQSVISIDQFRHIAIANFNHKLITKILTGRLAYILHAIISKEENDFIYGRSIKDSHCLTSEIVNLLDKKYFGGTVVLKFDISKAFNTIKWSFLIKVLNTFGFVPKFCNWILVILKLAHLFIDINGKHRGFFDCHNGVR